MRYWAPLKKPSAMEHCYNTKCVSTQKLYRWLSGDSGCISDALELHWRQLKEHIISPERFFEKILKLTIPAAREALQRIQGDPDRVRRMPRNDNIAFWTRIGINKAGGHEIFVDGIQHFDEDIRRRLTTIGETKITEALTTMGEIVVDLPIQV
ncbi:uncharacterized protein [Venturia canescens]|uniref:uncharacterized protein n=1 Tax=Venturia canescens TaxID=32260 RepID=UPI001C9D6214|nr:uncharacterized protein LOC122408300 [Venturia canescens]